MPNERNLVSIGDRTTEEQREIQSAGGRASGASRRRRRSLREAADLYLSLPVADKRAWNKLARDGVDPEDVDNQMAIVAGLTIKADVYKRQSGSRAKSGLFCLRADFLDYCCIVV